MCSLEAELEQENQMDDNKPESIAENKRVCDLEDQLIQSEFRLSKHSESLAQLNEQIQSLEMNHCILIRTRRKFEDEALNLSRFNVT